MTKQHACGTVLLHKLGISQNFGSQIDPLDRLACVAGLGCKFEFGLTVRFAIERFSQYQVPIGNMATVGGGDLSVLHGEARGGLIEFGRSQVQQNGPHFRAGVLHSGGAIRHGERACCHAFVGDQSGVARDDLDTRQINVQFIGADL